MVKIKGLQHIGILVPDVDAAAGWYTGKSGFRKKAEFMASGSRVIFVYSPESGVLCELIERPKGSGEAEKKKKNGGRIDHIAYEVEDLETEFEEAKACGMEIIEGIEQVPEFWENGFAYFLVYSPGGEKVEYCKVL